MRSTPFFSILIPTFRRPDLICVAIESVLRQNYDDFEVLVSNNGACSKTRDSVALYLGDHRVNYIENDVVLSMVSHWDKITRLSNGRYVLILTDRCLLKQGALHYLWSYICSVKRKIEIISWPWDLYLDKLDVLLPADSKSEQNVLEIDSNHYLKKLATTIEGVDYVMPRGMNSCVDASFLKELIARYDQVFRTIAPDVTFSFYCLMNSRSISYINNSLMVSRGVNVSTGGRAYLTTIEEYLTSINTEHPFEVVPCNVPFVVNAIFEDFLKTSAVCSRKDVYDAFCKVNYYEKLLTELDAKIIAHQISFSRIRLFRIEILRALSDESLTTRQQVKALRQGRLVGVAFRFLRRVFVECMEGIFGAGLNGFRVRAILVRGEGVKYAGALESAGFRKEDVKKLTVAIQDAT